MRPPQSSTNRWLMARPSPVPLSLVVKKGTNRLFSTCGRDARTVVAHGDFDQVVLRSGSPPSARGSGAVTLALAAGRLERVLYQVHQHLPELFGIRAHQRQLVGQLGAHRFFAGVL